MRLTSMLLDMCIHVSTKSHDKHPLAPEYIQHVTIIVSRTTTWYEWGAVGQGQIARAQFTCRGHPVGILKGNKRVAEHGATPSRTVSCCRTGSNDLRIQLCSRLRRCRLDWQHPPSFLHSLLSLAPDNPPSPTQLNNAMAS